MSAPTDNPPPEAPEHQPWLDALKSSADPTYVPIKWRRRLTTVAVLMILIGLARMVMGLADPQRSAPAEVAPPQTP